jgi:hypothetical protein
MKLSEPKIYEIFKDWLLSNEFTDVTFKSTVSFPNFTILHDGFCVGIQIIITDELSIVKEKVINTFSQSLQKKNDFQKIWLFFIHEIEPTPQKTQSKIELYLRDYSDNQDYETTYSYIDENLNIILV